jgi:HSP20 family protein
MRRCIDRPKELGHHAMSYRDHRETDLLRQMEHEMQRIADEALRGFFADVPPPNKFWQPRTDVHETAESVQVKMEAAGVQPDKLSVSLSSDGRVLTVAGERHEEDEERLNRIRCYQLEIYFGPFERQVVLPGDVHIDRDGITANYKDGILVVTLPKRTGHNVEVRSVTISSE